jgi:hypothetical protein
MERFDLNYMDLSGGLNLGPSPTDIKDSEASSLINYLPVTSDLRLRGGFQRKTEAYSSDGGTTYPSITGILPWSGNSPREWDLFVGTFNSFARWQPTTSLWTRVTRTDAPAPGDYPLHDEPWCMLQYRSIIYAFRRDVGMRRISRSPLQDSPPGIPAPTSAPTLADGAAGDIPAASFQGMVTFYSQATGAESNPSPASTVLAHAGGLRINWTNLPTAAPLTAPQVSHIRLYRTLPDKVSTVAGIQVQGYLVTTLTIGTASYVDNSLVEQLGASVSFKNSVPPASLRSGVIWQERLWTHDGRNLYVSEIGKPESIPAVNVLQVFPDDGQEITGLAADETRLFVGKDASVIYLTGNVGSDLSRHVLDANNGVTSHHTMKAVGGRLVWRSGNDVLMSEGGPGQSLTTGRKLRTYMEHVKGEQKYTEVAEVIPEQNLYVFMGRFEDKTAAQLKHPHAIEDRDVLAVNYETGAWGMMRFPLTENKVINTFRTVLDEDGNRRFFLGWEAFVHEQTPGLFYDEEPVPASSTAIRTTPIAARFYPRETSAPPGHQLASRSLWLDSTLRSTLTGDPSQAGREGFIIHVFKNGDYTFPINVVPNDVVLTARHDQVFSLNMRNYAASKLLVGVDRTLISQTWDIFGIGLGGWKIARRHRPLS